ncbi:MAG: hypothetical protein AMXMBFR23_27670 [Chloroflexota bacterium]
MRTLAAAALSLVASAGPLEGASEAFALAAAAGVAATAGTYAAASAARTALRNRTQEVRAVAHDLRAPLNTMSSYVGLVASGAFGPVSDEACAALRRVVEVAASAQAVVDSTLRVNDEASVAVPLHDPSVDLARVVAEAVAALDSTIRERGGEVVVDGTMPRVAGDATALFRVVENLVQNGLKFAPAGQSPRVLLRARAERGRVILDVQDNGTGFSMADRRHVFAPGARGDASTCAPGEGLGLNTVQRLVAGMHGTVELPECASGALVRVTLPAA